MNRKNLSKENSNSRREIMFSSLPILLLVFILSSCATMDQSVDTMKGYLPNIEVDDFIIGENTSVKKERLLKRITPFKEASFIFSPIISLQDLNKEGLQKNKFFLAGEIYSQNPEEPVGSLSTDNCFSPSGQGLINNMERLYHIFIKDLGLDSTKASEIDNNDNIDIFFLIQPVLLKYQYCKKAEVEIRYLVQNNAGTQTIRTIKTSHRAEGFKFPEKDNNFPFINYDYPGTQFPGLRHALTMAFYENTMDLLEMISKEYKKDEAK
jgi:hypothetical protein